MLISQMDKLLPCYTLFIMLLCIESSISEGHCRIRTVSEDPLCVGEIKCTQCIDDISKETLRWNCSGDYRLRLVIENLDFKHKSRLVNAQKIDERIYDNIESITMTNEPQLKEIPFDIYELFNGVKTIDLNNNAFNLIYLDNFLFYAYLERIDVSNNKIVALGINDHIRMGVTLNKVSSIDLSFNRLNELYNESFQPFTRLRHLNLSNNDLKSLDEHAFLGLNNLKTLNLSQNKLQQIDLFLDPLVEIKELYLDHNEIVSLMDFNFRSLAKLEILDVSSNKLVHIDALALHNLYKLYSLDLSNNTDCFSGELTQKFYYYPEFSDRIFCENDNQI